MSDVTYKPGTLPTCVVMEIQASPGSAPGANVSVAPWAETVPPSAAVTRTEPGGGEKAGAGFEVEVVVLLGSVTEMVPVELSCAAGSTTPRVMLLASYVSALDGGPRLARTVRSPPEVMSDDT